MPKDRNDSDERLVHQLVEAITGLTCAVNRATGEGRDRDARLLEASLWRVQQLARRLRRLARAMHRLDMETER